MTTFEATSPQNGREARNFHPGDTFRACPKQGFSRVSDSKTRGKMRFLRNIKLKEVKRRLRRHFLMALHGLKCERGKKILKRWGFLGVREAVNGCIRAENFAFVNNSFFLLSDGHAGIGQPPPPPTRFRGVSRFFRFVPEAWGLLSAGGDAPICCRHTAFSISSC